MKLQIVTRVPHLASRQCLWLRTSFGDCFLVVALAAIRGRPVPLFRLHAEWCISAWGIQGLVSRDRSGIIDQASIKTTLTVSHPTSMTSFSPGEGEAVNDVWKEGKGTREAQYTHASSV